MDRRWWIAGGALLAAVVLWVALVPMRASESATEPSAPVEQPPAAQAAEPSTAPDTAGAPTQAQPSAAPAPPHPPTAAAVNEAQRAALVPVPAPAGPVAKLKQSFETEPRDSAATGVESKIADAFRQPGVAAGLLRSILCRKSVCRVTVTWSRDRATSYMGVMMRLVLGGDFAPQMAAEPVGALDASGQQEINVYIVRGGPAPAATP